MKTLSLLLFLFSFSSFALSEGVYTVIIKKQEEKKKNRWTLADWLVTKKTMALQDQWLALNSSSTWFEFIFDYASGTLDHKVEESTREVDFSRYGGAIYVKFLGFEYNSYDYSKFYDQSDYRVNLIILGSSVQSTHLRAFFGKRDYSYENYSSYDQKFWGGHLSLYLASFLGVEGQFAKFSETSSDNNLFKSDGERRELSAFIDLWMFRVFATQYRERMFFRSTNSLRKTTLEGTLLGAKLFF